MRREEDISGVILLNQQTKKLRQEAIELNTQTKKKQLDEEWEDFLKKQEIMKAKMIAKLEKEAKKGGKKKKKKSAKWCHCACWLMYYWYFSRACSWRLLTFS